MRDLCLSFFTSFACVIVDVLYMQKDLSVHSINDAVIKCVTHTFLLGDEEKKQTMIAWLLLCI